jgi:N-acetylmuramoyl-L-alanine amidase
MPCNQVNHGGKRCKKIDFIVVHYTAGKNDKATDDGEYFSGADTGKTSAHYFVDETTTVQSVADEFVAYHCGGVSQYRHPRCRNSNSLGVEICCKYTDGVYYFATAAMDRAAWLVWELMQKYDILIENVVRHYDVTGKICPAPFVGEGKMLWNLFRERVMEMEERVFKDVDPVAWYADNVAYCVKHGLMNGVDDGEFQPNRSVTRAELATVLRRIHEKG